MREELIETLRQAQRLGFFGSRSIDDAVEHALGYVRAIGELRPGSRLIDLGSGGGLPGLVLAEAFPDCEIVLLDRRQKRTDFLFRAVARLGDQHVTVVCADARRFADAVSCAEQRPFDVVTARGFGPPGATLNLARRLLAEPGMIVISEPPNGDRWDEAQVAGLGLEHVRVGNVRRFTLAARR